MEVSGQLHGPTDSPPANEPRCSLNRWLGGPPRPFGRFEEKKNLQSLPEFEYRIYHPLAYLSYRPHQKINRSQLSCYINEGLMSE